MDLGINIYQLFPPFDIARSVHQPSLAAIWPMAHMHTRITQFQLHCCKTKANMGGAKQCQKEVQGAAELAHGNQCLGTHRLHFFSS